jgi:uncharacterized delta-60 repeat protein
MRVVGVALLLLLAALAPAADARTDRLDRSFGGGRGSIRVFVGGGDSQAYHAVRTRTGKLLLVGSARAGGAGRYGVGLARLHPSGRVDRRFGRRGRAIIGPGRFGDPRAVVQRPDGGLLIAVGMTPAVHGNNRIGVIRVSAGGRWDRSFGTDGVADVELPLASGEYRADVGMAVSHGRPVLALTTRVDGREQVVLVRFTAAGSLDPAFGQNGLAHPDLGEPGASAAQLARSPDGRLLLSARRGATPGYSYPVAPATFVVRIAEDGTVEPGWRVAADGVDPYDLAVEPGGGIAALVHRSGATGEYSRWGVLRWRADGRLRAGFERHLRRPPFSSRHSFPTGGFARDARGRFYVPSEFGAMARVRRDGRADGSWARGGLTRRLRGRLWLWAHDVVVLSRRRVVSVGYGAREVSREDFGRSGMWVAAFR